MLTENPTAIFQALYGQITQGGTVNTLAVVWLTMSVIKLQAQMTSMTQTIANFMTVFRSSHAGQPEKVQLQAGDD